MNINTKIMVGILSAFVLSVLGGLAYAGYKFSWGQFKFLNEIALSLKPGNASVYDVSNVEVLKESALKVDTSHRRTSI